MVYLCYWFLIPVRDMLSEQLFNMHGRLQLFSLQCEKQSPHMTVELLNPHPSVFAWSGKFQAICNSQTIYDGYFVTYPYNSMLNWPEDSKYLSPFCKNNQPMADGLV